MKLSTISLVVASLLSTSAYAIDNVKVNGDAKLFYSTNDADSGGQSVSLFNKTGAMGQAAIGLGATADLTKGVSAGIHFTGLSTLGLQNQLVSGVWESTNGVSDSWWFDEAWIAGTLGKTTAKVGRMELDTPIVFTEKWSIVKNTFEAAVLINQDIPDTTLVAAYVGGTNSNNIVNPVTGGSAETNPALTGLGNAGGVIQKFNTNGSTNFGQFYRGAYAIAAINNSYKPLTVQIWGYAAPEYLTAYWLQGDFKMDGILAGAQYTNTDYNQSVQLPIGQDVSNDAWAIMGGYAMKNVATVKLSFSQTGTESNAGLGAGMNLAGGASAQSKLYTEAWWNYGYITRADTQSYNISVTGNVAGFDLAAYYTNANSDKNGGTATRPDMKEFTLTGGHSFGPLDATVAYIYTNADDQNLDSNGNGQSFNTVQAYLTYKF